ncbi:hypothetical protein EHM69_06945 [candidate division KSB1 bacterium]|nr:MAG: hypothetical protein EHM69_06945 [candidate division KSB1 bacterium]
MSRPTLTVFLFLCALCLMGCHQDKSLGPQPAFPEGGTRLYFAECEPLVDYPVLQESVTLSADPEDACGQHIEFNAYSAFSWRSNFFASASGTIREGCHLVFVRSVAEAANAGAVAVQFHGLAVNFYREIVLPAGETVFAIDEIESAAVPDAPDSARYISIYIRSISDTFRLKSSFPDGSFVYSEANRNGLCEFTISLGLSQGIGSPNGGVNFYYEHAASAVHAYFLRDFTGGAWVENTFMHFGPRYGACYLVGEAAECRDTAVFWSPAPEQHYRTAVLATLNGWPSLLSDGQHVWLYGTSWLQQETGPRREVRITNRDDVLLVAHAIWDSVGSVRLAYDRLNQLIWIVERMADRMDTAWGYTPEGRLDSTIISESIPFGNIRQGQWVVDYEHDAYVRTISAEPLNGGSSVVMGEYPTDLSNSFAGEAGYAYPGIGNMDSWSINLFDANAHWIARYPLTGGGSESVHNVRILLADEVIVYVLCTFDANNLTFGSYVRSLRSD